MRKVLTILLGILLVLQLLPVSSIAEELSIDDDVSSVFLEGSLRTAEGHTYVVTVACDEDSGIPEDAQLLVREPEPNVDGQIVSDEAALEARRARLRSALVLDDEDELLYEDYLDLEIVVGERDVRPQSPVSVTIQTDALLPDDAEHVQVALLAQDGAVPDVQDQSEEGEDASAAIGFVAESLGIIGLAIVESAKPVTPATHAVPVVEEAAFVDGVSAVESEPEGEVEPAIEPLASQDEVESQDDGATLRTLSQTRDFATESTGDTRATTETSPYFWIKWQADNGQYHTTKVTYVCSDRTDLRGTITGTIIKNLGEEVCFQTDFAQFLAPDIADDYVFSRVFIKLKKEEKNFQRMQARKRDTVSFEGNAGGYRVYVYGEDISECGPGGVYKGTWYTYGAITNTDPVYIMYDPVSEASFLSVDDTGENNPVPGAEYTLYSDRFCYTEYMRDGQVVTAVSDVDGHTSFGKLPYGTYYMRETRVPTGYKDTGTVYQIEVSANTNIANVVHEEDDGSVIVTNVQSMTIHKVWADNKPHTSDEVWVQLNAQGEEPITKTLTYSANADESWKATVTGLDPTLSYVVTETDITEPNGAGTTSVRKNYIPNITYTQGNPTVGYYKADAFVEGKTYVLMTESNGALARGADGRLTVTKAIGHEGHAVTGSVTEDMQWKVVSVHDDGVVVLQNVGGGTYLDYVGSAWTLKASQPQFVKHTPPKEGGLNGIDIYYIVNLSNAQRTYLNITDAGIVATGTKPTSPVFGIYQQTDAYSMDAVVTNKDAEPIKIRNMEYYPDHTAVSGMEYELWTKGEATSMYSGLVANSDGFLEHDSSDIISLQAGTYELKQVQSKGGYVPHSSSKPIEFTVTTGGALQVTQSTQAIPDFAYSSTWAEGEGQSAVTYPLLQVPNQRPASVTLMSSLSDFLADSATFSYTVTLLNSSKQPVSGWALGSGDGMTTGSDGSVSISLAPDATSAERTLQVPAGCYLRVVQGATEYIVDVQKNDEAPQRTTSLESQITADTTIAFVNRRTVCVIQNGEDQVPFESFAAALAYARQKMSGQATIQLVVDYPMTQADTVTIGAGDDITITTASTHAGKTATVTRDYDGNSMFTVMGGGTLTLTNIVLDGAKESHASTQDGGLVRVEAGTLSVAEGATLRNSTAPNGGGVYVADGATMVLSSATEAVAQVSDNEATDAGGGVYVAAGGTIQLAGLIRVADNTTSDATAASEGSDLYLAAESFFKHATIKVMGDIANDSLVYVWAADSVRDGTDLAGDEPFAITANAQDASTVKGLNRIRSQLAKALDNVEVSAAASLSSASASDVVWPTSANAAVVLDVEGSYADKLRMFEFTVTLPEGVTELQGTVNGAAQTFTARNNTFKLADGQRAEFADIRTVLSLTVTSVSSSTSDTNYQTTMTKTSGVTTNAVVETSGTDSNVFTLSELWGSPVELTITKTLADDDVPGTGIGDNAVVWGTIATASACTLAVLWLRRRHAV